MTAYPVLDKRKHLLLELMLIHIKIMEWILIDQYGQFIFNFPNRHGKSMDFTILCIAQSIAVKTPAVSTLDFHSNKKPPDEDD